MRLYEIRWTYRSKKSIFHSSLNRSIDLKSIQIEIHSEELEKKFKLENYKKVNNWHEPSTDQSTEAIQSSILETGKCTFRSVVIIKIVKKSQASDQEKVTGPPFDKLIQEMQIMFLH